MLDASAHFRSGGETSALTGALQALLAIELDETRHSASCRAERSRPGESSGEAIVVEMGAGRVASPMRAALHASVEPPLPSGVAIRPLRPTDARRLATLMVVAYAGTVDDHGQPPSFAEAEARRTIAGHYGEVQWDASLMAHTSGDESVGTTVVTWDRGHLLLAFALVAPEWRNQGLGTALIIRTANRLAAEGATEWTLAVTVGNPAQRLYERLGFRVDRSL